MTITIEKKHVYTFLGIVAIFLFLFLVFKACGKPNYETTAKEMKLNTMATCYLAAEVLSDYQESWRSAIHDNKAKNAEGEDAYTYDFNEAIRWRYQYYLKNGRISDLDSLANLVKGYMKDMDNPPSKFDKTQESFVGMYNDMNTLLSLVNNPKGSLMTFGAKVNELLMSVDTKFKETDLKISVPEDSVRAKVFEIKLSEMASMISTKAEELNKYQSASKSNSDRLKKEGFQEIPNGKGVLYKVIKSGNGKMPKEDSFVKVHYAGKTVDGEEFDSSWKRGEPIIITPNQVIRGWTTTLTNMHEGDRWEIFIPYDQAYGDKPQRGIPAYSDLMFDIELLKVNAR
jgi:FKBP-type peptidyl-prolyl cis-trans isomerase